MENNEAINKIEQTLDHLESSFKNFQTKHEQRFQQLYVKDHRPLFDHRSTSPIQSEQKQVFLDYVSKGIENFQKKALTSQQDKSGGYLIPHPIMERLETSLRQVSPLRSLARVTNITADSLDLLLDKGYADVGWVSETEDRAETHTPELTKLKIPVHQLYAKPRASQKILDDAQIDVENWLVSKITEKMAAIENHAFIHGDGEGKPRGFLNYPLVSGGKGEWGKIEMLSSISDGAFIDGDVLLDTLNLMEGRYLSGAVWFMSRSALAAVQKVKLQGNYIWQPGLIAGIPHTLLGYPVVISDDMPALVSGTASTSIVFANFYEAYQIVDRSGLHVLRDPYSAKPYVEFYTTKRVGGDVVNFEAIKAIRFEKG